MTSFNTQPIPYNKHKEWFFAKLRDTNYEIVIAMLGKSKKVGYVRYEIDPRQRAATISICMDKRFRGLGLGMRTLKMASDYVARKYALDKMIAFVRHDNTTSFRFFQEAGFHVTRDITLNGKKGFLLEYKCKKGRKEAACSIGGKRISGKRIYLREVRPSDAEGSYFHWINDKEVTQFTESRYRHHSKEDLISYISRMRSDPACLFLAIVAADSDRHIGNIKIGPINRIHHFADVGILIGDKAYWGKGFATEAIKLVTAYAFRNMGLHKLMAGCYSNNISAIKAFKNSGYAEEGRLKSNFLHRGKFVDRICLGIINKKFYRLSDGGI